MYGSRHLHGDLASFADLGQLQTLYLQATVSDTSEPDLLRYMQSIVRLTLHPKCSLKPLRPIKFINEGCKRQNAGNQVEKR